MLQVQLAARRAVITGEAESDNEDGSPKPARSAPKAPPKASPFAKKPLARQNSGGWGDSDGDTEDKPNARPKQASRPTSPSAGGKTSGTPTGSVNPWGVKLKPVRR